MGIDISDLIESLANADMIELGHPMTVGMPGSPNHPAFGLTPIRRHGDVVRPDGASAANELITMVGGHVGTHIDSFGHVSNQGLLLDGTRADAACSHLGLSRLGVEEIGPLFMRGVALDIADLHDCDVLPPGYEVTSADLEEACARRGLSSLDRAAVLIRSGWSAYWDSPTDYVGLESGGQV